LKVWKLLFSSGGSLGVCVVRCETRDRAKLLAIEFAKKEDLNKEWLEYVEPIECIEGEGVLAWGES
jgi:hypothetical protein